VAPWIAVDALAARRCGCIVFISFELIAPGDSWRSAALRAPPNFTMNGPFVAFLGGGCFSGTLKGILVAVILSRWRGATRRWNPPGVRGIGTQARHPMYSWPFSSSAPSQR